MEISIVDSGIMGIKMDMGRWNIIMEISIMDNGVMI